MNNHTLGINGLTCENDEKPELDPEPWKKRDPEPHSWKPRTPELKPCSWKDVIFPTASQPWN